MFSYDPWGTSGQVHDNCYDYAFGSYSSKRPTKSVPGNRSGITANGLTFTKCTGLAELIQSDNPRSVYRMKSITQKCRPGYYKVVCLVAPSNDFGNYTGDFHFIKNVGSVRYKIRAGDTVKGLAKFFHDFPDQTPGPAGGLGRRGAVRNRNVFSRHQGFPQSGQIPLDSQNVGPHNSCCQTTHD